jgi:von Willebrand factor type A domain
MLPATALLAALVALASPVFAAEVHLADDSLLGPSSPPPTHRLPVLFVHGHNPTAGDADFNYKKDWWNALNGLPAMKQALELTQNGALDIEPYYIRFQDQDHSITDDAADIAEAVDEILHRQDPSFDPADPNATTPVQIAIVAFSKGTISARQYLKSLQTQVAGMPAPRPGFRPVSEFVAISPPNHALDTILFATTTSLAVRQLYNGYRPQGVFFNCGDSFNTPAATDYIEALNGHPIEDTESAPFGDFASEAPDSRPDGAAPHAGVLYVTLYASGDRDLVGGDDPSGDCQGRRVARNLAPDAVNIAVPEVTGGTQGDVHQNTVHTKEVLCLALYAVVHHRSPIGQVCSYSGNLPIVPLPARAAAMLALDLSGSMLAPVCPGCGSRLDTLKDSVELFVQLWSLLGGPEDRVGVTYFRTDVDQYLGGTLPLLIGNETALIGEIAGQMTQPANMTAMGGALQTAIGSLDPALVDAERRHVILFTDGMQNVNPMVRAVASAPPQHDIGNEAGRPASNVSPSVPPIRLDQLADITVDTIGIGAGEAFLGLLEDIAAETGGVTKATVAPDDELRRFFVEELISSLRGFSPQLVGYRHGALSAGGGGSETFLVNGGAKKLVLKLSWRRGQTLGLRVFKDGIDVTGAGRFVAGAFYRLFAIDLPTGGGMTSGGEWRLAIEGKPGATYEAAAIVDEHRLAYDIAFGHPPVRVGDSLELTVRLTVDGKPVAGDVTVGALLQRPRTAAGTLLAAMKPQAGPAPAGSEPHQRAAERQLLALAADKAATKRLAPVIEKVRLEPAGPGIFTLSVRPTVPGVYSATVTVRGDDPALGRFERTGTATAVVRFGKAVLSASELRLREHPGKDADRMLELVLRPRDRYGNLLGPGLAASLAVELSAGRAVGGAQDLGGGRYLFLLRTPKLPGVRLTLSVGGAPLFDGSLEALRRLAGG